MSQETKHQTPNTKHQTPNTKHRRLRWLVLVAVLLLAALAVAFRVFRRDDPGPPVLDLTGVDPAVKAVIESAQAKVRQSPREGQHWGLLGMVLFAHGYIEDSDKCFLRARQLDPREPRWPYYRGVVLIAIDSAAALEELRRAVDLWGEEIAPRLRLANLLLDQGRVEEAAQEYSHVLGQSPGNAPAHLGLARVAVQANDFTGALKHLEHCRSEGAIEKPARTLRAECYHRLGDLPAAERERALAKRLPEPGPPVDWLLEEMFDLAVGQKAIVEKCNKLFQQGRTSQATTVLLQAVRDYPESATLWLVLGRSYLEQDELKQAERALRTALTHDARLVEANFCLGVALLSQGQTKEAARYFEKTVELRPGYVQAHCHLGHCLAQQGKRAEAIKAFQTALRYKPYFTFAHTNLGDLLGQEGQLSEARKHLELALSLDPDDKQARELLKKYGK
jgi:tetratricopeptide (TPR) repeat protein